jgi:hypothetical protein
MSFKQTEYVCILIIPLKKKIAEERLEAAELRVAAETLRLVAEVKAAYFTYQGEQQVLTRLKIIQETNAAALDLGFTRRDDHPAHHQQRNYYLRILPALSGLGVDLSQTKANL